MLWFTKSRRAQSDTDFETWLEGGVVPTLNAFDNGDIRATTIIAFHPTQTPISGEVSPALGTTTGGMGVVAFSPSDFANYSEGVGTLKAGMTNNNSPILAFDSYNHTVSKTNQTLRKGNGGIDHTGGIVQKATVRRLTPVECERLQGFPDDWTAGQSDTHRYKQMGNAVAVPVVEWILTEIVNQLSVE